MKSAALCLGLLLIPLAPALAAPGNAAPPVRNTGAPATAVQGSAKAPPAKAASTGVKPLPAPGRSDTAPSAEKPRSNDVAGRGAESPELAAMREADRELFGFAARTPGAAGATTPLIIDEDRPQVRSSGLPPWSIAGAGPSSDCEPARDLGWLRLLREPGLAARWDSRVVRYLDFYRRDPRGKSLLQRWVKKSGRYGGAIRRALREQGLPEDLIWVALIESGFEPAIKSPAGAAGLWQLMPEGARAYGLVVDRSIDERLDPERSTQAAARYLADLHRRLGTWELALAAYNMGYGGLLAAMRKYNTTDYWELGRVESGIPFETTLYVPKIVAMAVAAQNAAVFGVDSVHLDPAVEFDSVVVPPGMSIRAIAAAAGVDARIIETLNPQLRGGGTPKPKMPSEGLTFAVRVPVGKGSQVSERLAKVRVAERTAERVPSLSDAVDSTGRSEEPARKGAVLLVPPAPKSLDDEKNESDSMAVTTLPAEEARPSELATRVDSVPRAGASADDKPVAVVPPQGWKLPGKKRVFYRTAPGDTLGEIAGRFAVSADELCRWNALDPAARLPDGLMLQVFAARATNLARVNHLGEDSVRCITVGSDEFFDYFEALRGRKRATIVVAEGDTWERLAKRFNLSVGQLERINQRSHTEKLVPNQTMVVYAPVGRPLTRPEKLGTSEAVAEPRPIIAPSPDDLPPLPQSSAGGASSP